MLQTDLAVVPEFVTGQGLSLVQMLEAGLRVTSISVKVTATPSTGAVRNASCSSSLSSKIGTKEIVETLREAVKQIDDSTVTAAPYQGSKQLLTQAKQG